jgi:hypothetical protein
MKDNFYKQLIEKSKAGYAYYRIICDEDGIPCDYEFIEVNATFEKLTGIQFDPQLVSVFIKKVLG